MKKKPLSPHIQIYRPQITSVLSITHRFTGLLLVFGTVLFCFGFLALSLNASTWACFVQLYKCTGGKIWQWLLIFSLHYHALNGIRHLLWDAGFGFEIKTVKQTGLITIFLSILLTLLFYFYCSPF